MPECAFICLSLSCTVFPIIPLSDGFFDPLRVIMLLQRILTRLEVSHGSVDSQSHGVFFSLYKCTGAHSEVKTISPSCLFVVLFVSNV